VPNPERRSVGERVRVGVGEGSVRRSALAAYAFPWLALLRRGAGRFGCWQAKQGRSAARIVGLLVGWLGLRRAQRRDAADPRCQPSITS
jgi:positive regulator of sigma E activity